MSQTSAWQTAASEALEKASPESYPPRESEAWRKVRLDGVDLFTRSDDAPLPVEIAFSPEKGSGLDTYEMVLPSAPLSDMDLSEAALNLGFQSEPSPHMQERWNWLLERASRDCDPFELINLARSKPLTLRISQNGSYRIRFQQGAGDLTLPAIYVNLERSVEAQLILEYEDTDGSSAEGRIWSPTAFFDVGQNAKLQVLERRKYGDWNFHFHRLDFFQGRDSDVHYACIHSGGLTGKGFVRSRALEKGAQFRGIGLFTGKGAQFHDMEMEVSHEADHCISTLLYKTVLKDRAHSVFNGNLIAPPHIKKVDSHQTNHNIVLSKKARAESMPRLVIQSEDVACEHGATVGDLSEEALFFLQCRGVPLEEARRLLIEGFMEEILMELILSEDDKQKLRSELFPIIET